MAIAIAAASIVLLALRPPRVPDWVWPTAGALLVVLIGYVPVTGAIAAIAGQWNVLLFILGLMGISAAAEESGAFAWIADYALAAGRGSRRRLFVLLFGTCAVVTILLSNDATAIALTPIVYRAVATRATIAKPFLFGCVFAANTASFGLPFSNPANVLILPHAELSSYVLHLGPPQIGAIALNLAVLLFFFRRELRGRYEPVRLEGPSARARRVLAALAVLIVAYLLALLLRWPLGPVASAFAVLTLAIAGVPAQRAARRISWRTLVLLAGLFVLLDAVTRAGLVSWALAELERALRYGALAVMAAAAGGAAVLSNLFNNLPVAVSASSIVARLSLQQIAYPLIVGVDVGPNLLTTGSLATILWMATLRRYGERVSLREYIRLGALTVPATLAICLLWFWFVGIFIPTMGK